MADLVDKSSLESPKKRPRLEHNEPVDMSPNSVEAEKCHVPTGTENNSIHSSREQFSKEKDSLNFDLGSGAGFEQGLPPDTSHVVSDRFTSDFDDDFLPEQNGDCHSLLRRTSSSSPIASDTNNTSPIFGDSDAESDGEDSSSVSDEGSLRSLDGDLDLGLGDCDLVQPTVGPMGWLQRQMMSGVHPRSILSKLLPNVSASLPQDLDEFEVWSIIADYFNMLREPPRRKKLPDVNSFEDALNLLRSSKRIMVLTGAGVSVSCGIPDFRSRDGVYARLAVDFPDLPDPQAIFDINYFRRNPRPFFKFAKEIYPGEFRPSTCHKFIALLEQHGKLLRNFSQNIDTLEQVAGITKVLQCHGSFAAAHCTNCNYKVDADSIREDIFNQVVPHCPLCPRDPDVLAVMKPDIVFFGEGLPKDFYHCLDEDKDKIDLLIVIGSSLKVQPVATIPNAVPGHVPQILINREPLSHMNFDIELLGDGDVIVNEICRRLGDGWDHICDGNQLEETSEMPDVPTPAGSDSAGSDFETMVTPKRPEEGFEGADSTSWVGQSEGKLEDSLQSCDDNAETIHREDNSKGDNSKGEIEKSTMPEKPPKSPNMCGAAEKASSADTAHKAHFETKISNSKPELDVALIKKDETHQERNSLPNPLTCPQSKPVIDILVMDKSQQQDGDISSTVCEDVKPKSAQSNCTNANQLAEEHYETNEALSQDTRESLEAENVENAGNRGAHSCSVGNGGGDNNSKEGTAEGESRSFTKTSDDHATQPKRKRKSSIALYLQSSSYLFVPPNRYIFHGAEVYPPSKPVSPRKDTDDISDRHSADNHDKNDVEDHLRDFIDHSEVPSTSEAGTGDYQHRDLPPTTDSSTLHSECDPQDDPVFSDTHEKQERSELHSEKAPLCKEDEGIQGEFQGQVETEVEEKHL